MSLSRDDIIAIKDLLRAATKGPWELDAPYGPGPAKGYRPINGYKWGGLVRVVVEMDREPYPQGEANAALIVALVNHAEEFLSAAERVGELEEREILAQARDEGRFAGESAAFWCGRTCAAEAQVAELTAKLDGAREAMDGLREWVKPNGAIMLTLHGVNLGVAIRTALATITPAETGGAE